MPYRAWVNATTTTLRPLADAGDAQQMQRYMKDVAPYLGIRSAPRRKAQKLAWKSLPALDEGDLERFVLEMWKLPEREFQYAGIDALDWYRDALHSAFLQAPVQHLVTAKPWWDTVDGLGSAIITPLVNSYPALTATMWKWLESGDIWLARAAIQHQRGNKDETDLDLLFAMCEVHVTDREFWLAKAIGWALRDVSAYWPEDVQAFVERHPNMAPVARREAQRGIDRAMGSANSGHAGAKVI